MSHHDLFSIRQPLHQQLLDSCKHFSWYQYHSKDDQLGFSMHQVFCNQWALCWINILIWVTSGGTRWITHHIITLSSRLNDVIIFNKQTFWEQHLSTVYKVFRVCWVVIQESFSFLHWSFLWNLLLLLLRFLKKKINFLNWIFKSSVV